MRRLLRRLHQKKYKGISLLVPVLIIVGIIFLMIWLVLGIHISFAIKDEMMIRVDPLHTTKTISNNDSFNMSFLVKTDNFWQCRSVCEINFSDLSEDALLFTAQRQLSHDGDFTQMFAIDLDRRGEGQKVYRLRVACVNEKTFFCPTDERYREAIATLTLNYELTSEEVALKEALGPGLSSWLSSIATVNATLAHAIERNDVLPESEERFDIDKRLASVGEGLAGFGSGGASLLRSWEEETYEELSSDFLERDQEGLLSLNVTLGMLMDEQDRVVSFWNGSVDIRDATLDVRGLVFEASRFFEAENNRVNQKYLIRLGDSLDTIYAASLDLSDGVVGSVGALGSIGDMYGEMNAAYGSLVETLEYYEGVVARGDVLSAYGRELAFLALNRTVVSQDICSDAKNLSVVFEEANEELGTAVNRTDLSSGLSFIAAEVVAESKNMTVDDVLSLLGILPKNVSVNLSEKVKITLDPFQGFIEDSCGDPDFGRSVGINISSIADLGSGMLDRLSLPEHEVTFESVVIPENLPACCLWGVCAVCEVEGKTPLLFIHGHMFNEGNVPESSAEVFVPFQNALDRDFTNFGEVYSASPDAFDWERMIHPVSVRSSYYYVSYLSVGEYRINAQKSESIENYALRLREIIETVKLHTKSPKVHVIAHSMGGLVVRQYAELFGWDSLDKVVLIGTPNHGIGGTVKNVCSTFGSGKECDEMLSGSIFLSRLNAKPLPSGVDVTVMIGEGCSVEGEPGDGIVASKSAYLEGAENIVVQGSCNDRLKTSLHNDLLNPRLYPEVFSHVKEILES